jgi:magnesium-transporting ATPase (P-type)
MSNLSPRAGGPSTGSEALVLLPHPLPQRSDLHRHRRNVATRYAQHLAGTDVAMESAGVVLMRSDPMDVVLALELSRATLRKMRQNLVWPVLYNVIAFPLAAGVL